MLLGVTRLSGVGAVIKDESGEKVNFQYLSVVCLHFRYMSMLFKQYMDLSKHVHTLHYGMLEVIINVQKIPKKCTEF